MFAIFSTSISLKCKVKYQNISGKSVSSVMKKTKCDSSMMKRKRPLHKSDASFTSFKQDERDGRLLAIGMQNVTSCF